MIHFSKLRDIEDDTYRKRKTKKRPACIYSNTIYTFDIEVSNLFYMDGKWTVFDDTRDKDYYTQVEKIGVPYIWQFGINDTVYYGRELYDSLKVFQQIANPFIRKIIYIHNLSYEFQFLLNLLENYTITDMCCRDVHKPISFLVKELNIEFRCSYMLTNMSLAKSAAEFTDVKKLTGSLEYDKCVRTPLTKLTTQELLYAEYDVICLYKVVKYFKERYDNVLCKIPLTSTGEVRTAFRAAVDYYYIREMQNLVPDRQIYMILWACFSGGYTHSNVINTNRVIKNVTSKDIASSYPYSMLQKLPVRPFMRCFRSDFMKDPDYAYIIYVKLYGVKSRYYTHYIQYSKCVHAKNVCTDNGRVVSVDYVEMWVTDIDFQIIQKNYSIHHYIIDKCYHAYKDYLDERVINFILSLYGNKTTLKGVKESEVIYKRDKAMLNSLY